MKRTQDWAGTVVGLLLRQVWPPRVKPQGEDPLQGTLTTNRQWQQDGAKEETHSVPSGEEYAGDLTSKSANWFRFQDAEQKVKRLDFLLQQECSQARWDGTRQENPLGIGVSVG